MNKEKTNNEERAITLADLWRVFLTALPLMIIAAILVVGVGYAYRKLTYRQQYRSEGSFLVMRGENTEGALNAGGEAQLALLLRQSCYDVVTSYDVYYNTAVELNENGGTYSVGQIISAISVSINDNSLIMTIRATSTNRENAKAILTAFMQTAKEKADDLMNKGNDFVTYCDQPRDAVKTGGFGMLRILLIGVFAAIVVYAVYMILDLFDDRIRSGDDITDQTGLTLLGIIPDAMSVERKYAYKYGRKYAKHYGRYGVAGTQKKKKEG